MVKHKDATCFTRRLRGLTQIQLRHKLAATMGQVINLVATRGLLPVMLLAMTPGCSWIGFETVGPGRTEV